MPNLKNKFQYGDVIMFRPTGGFVSNAISKIGDSEYSHGAIFWKYVNGIPLFIESHESRGGVVINRLQEWSNFDVYRPKGLEIRPAHELLEMVGRRYDYSMLWWILKARILKTKVQNNDNALVICTELVDFVFYYSLGRGYVCIPKTVPELAKAGIFEKFN